MSNIIHHYCIYDCPKDYPNHFVVKRWVIPPTEGEAYQDPDFILIAKILEECRVYPRCLGLLNFGRTVEDDVNIVETWI